MKKIVTFLFVLSIQSAASAMATNDTAQASEQWRPPVPVFSVDYDWIRLTSDEWLKGDIIAMYDETLEFDSDELGLLSLDWDDIAELRSKSLQSIRMEDGTIVEGQLIVKDGELYLVKDEQVERYEYSQLLSIASAAGSEWDYWDGKVNLGVNFRRGNTIQFDYTITAEAQRRTSTSRFKIDYLASYSLSEDKLSGEETITADSDRMTASYDWFFSKDIFFRAAEIEYLSDEFQNIKHRSTIGIGLGYHLIDESKIKWDVTAGPSYQATKYLAVEEGTKDSEDSAALTLGTLFEYEISSDIDFDLNYSVQIVSENAGEYIHHFETGLDVELTNDFDLDLTFYVDRTEKPRTGEEGNTPEKNDYRFVISLGYDF